MRVAITARARDSSVVVSLGIAQLVALIGLAQLPARVAFGFLASRVQATLLAFAAFATCAAGVTVLALATSEPLIVVGALLQATSTGTATLASASPSYTEPRLSERSPASRHPSRRPAGAVGRVAAAALLGVLGSYRPMLLVLALAAAGAAVLSAASTGRRAAPVSRWRKAEQQAEVNQVATLIDFFRWRVAEREPAARPHELDRGRDGSRESVQVK